MIEQTVGIDGALDLEGVVVDENRLANRLGDSFRRRGVETGRHWRTGVMESGVRGQGSEKR